MPYSLIKSSPRTQIEDSPELNLKKIIYLLNYRKWMILFLFLVISSAVITTGKYLPRIYQANTTILFEPKDISRDFVRTVIDMPMEKRQLNLSKKIKSRGHIKQVIHELQLDSGISAPQKLEGLIAQMQEKINVEENTKNDAFSISCQGTDPQLVMQVANRITDLFIEEQQQDSQRRAKMAELLLGREMEQAEERLREQEIRIETFRQEHLGDLPEQEGFNLRMLEHLQSKLQDNERTMQGTQEQKQFLEKQLLLLGSISVEGSGDYSPPASYRRLEELKSELAKLRRKYSDRWREVTELKREIAALEQELESNSPDLLKGKAAASANPAYQELMDRISNINKTIDNLNKDHRQALEDIKEYKRRAEHLPKVKQELDGLMERYSLLKGDYESLRTKKLDAKLSENFESAGKNGYFTVLDRAELPLEPVKPTTQQILVIALLAGLGVGVGMAVFIERLDDSLKEPDEVESYLGLSVLGSIPVLKTSLADRQAKARRIRYAMLLCLYLVCVWLLIRYKEPTKSFIAAHNISGERYE